MDWQRAIARNREALHGIVAAVLALLGLEPGGTLGRIPCSLHRAACRMLVPAESAVRRLIVIAARGLVVKPRPPQPMPVLPQNMGRIVRTGDRTRFSFKLRDPRRRVASQGWSVIPRAIPRIHVFTADPRVTALWPQPKAEPAPPPDQTVDAAHLCRRLAALKDALDDLPRQARRLARWRARREASPQRTFTSPLRPGPPPGHRKRIVYGIDEVLRECHGLAFDALSPDTS